MDKVLELVRSELEQQIRNQSVHFSGADVVSLSTVPKSTDNSSTPLSMSLINIEEVQVNPLSKSYERQGNTVELLSNKIRLNLYVLISANANNYNKSLNYLSLAIKFFNENNVWNQQTHPKLPEHAAKLNFKLINYDLSDLKDLWSFLGGSYQPSIVYRIQGVGIGGELSGIIKPTVSKLRRLFRVGS